MPDFTFREATAADRDEILRLRRIAFPEDVDSRQSAAFWDWEFASSPLAPARVFIAEDDAGIVAHLGFVSQQYRVASRTVNALLAVDAMVHPRRRREALFTKLARYAVDRLRANVPLLVAWQIRSAVLAPMLAAGFDVAATVPLLMGPTSPSLAIAQYRRRSVAVHTPFDDAISIASSPGHEFRDAPRLASGGLTLREPTFEEASPLLNCVDDAMSLVMTREFSTWRFSDNPSWRYRLAAAFSGETIAALAVVRDTLMKGMPTRALVHVAETRGFAGALRQLLKSERVAARRAGIGLMSCLISSDHPAKWAVIRAGLLPSPFRFRLLAQAFDDTIRPAVLHGARHLTWAATDHV